MAWSRKMRLFPMESEGYLPVQEFTKTLMRMGYKGVWSLEVFNASLDSMKEDTVQTHGQRGIDGLKKLHEAVSR
jgi:4-hydroxyphenylpyruvate dioxygenase